MRIRKRRCCSSSVIENQYLTRTMPERTSRRSNSGHGLEEVLVFLVGAEAHHPFDAGAVVPAAVEQHDLAAGRQMRDIALEVPLAALALGRRGQRHGAADARVETLGDPLDGAALARRVASLEDDDQLELLGDDPVLELDELALQAQELLEIELPRQRIVHLADVRFRDSRSASWSSSSSSSISSSRLSWISALTRFWNSLTGLCFFALIDVGFPWLAPPRAAVESGGVGRNVRRRMRQFCDARQAPRLAAARPRKVGLGSAPGSGLRLPRAASQDPPCARRRLGFRLVAIDHERSCPGWRRCPLGASRFTSVGSATASISIAELATRRARRNWRLVTVSTSCSAKSARMARRRGRSTDWSFRLNRR